MQSLVSGPYIALDFETSAYNGPCACAIGMARLEHNVVVDTYYRLIRPPSRRIYFTRIHGLSWRDLKDQPDFAELWSEISAFIADAQFFIAHNARFDQNVLAACCDGYKLRMPTQSFLCTLRGARKALRLQSYSLASVAAFFKIDLTHHHAGSDALACGLIHARLHDAGLEDDAMLLPAPGLSRQKRT